MTVNRLNRHTSFTSLSNETIWDTNLSLPAIGLLTRLLSRPPDWHFHIRELASSCKCSKDFIGRLFKELIDTGYLIKRVMPRGERSRFSGVEWDVYDRPQREIQIISPRPVLPDPVGPAPVVQDILNTNPRKEEPYKEPPLCPPREPAMPLSIEAPRLAVHLLEKILEVDGTFKRRNIEPWVKDIDKLIRIDGRTPEQIEAVIEWTYADSFWRTNILSAAKLRKQFDQLHLKMTSAEAREGSDDNRDFARHLVKTYRDTYRNAKFVPEGIENPNTGEIVPFTLPRDQFSQAMTDAFLTANGYAR